MDRLEIDNFKDIYLIKLNNRKQNIIWNFNNNNNTQIFIKALFLLLLSISGGFI